jgi:hypothetical protein
MIQLTFEPALDPLHAVFRFLRLKDTLSTTSRAHRDLARILDFYLLFPFRIEGIRLAPQDRKYKWLSKFYSSIMPYGQQPEDRILFSRMEPMQIAALDTLASRGFILPEDWRLGEVKSTDLEPPLPIVERIRATNEADAALLEFLSALAVNYPLTGRDGLKDRTGLMEYRYDAV